ncbi:MAG TPA: disulfide bond formation protein DsbA [Pseudomonas xinjiangensis]|uniref:Disulfide bond formation protein DsbA n=2 Tax=root TaxID=1 RepID=A0A7V1BPD3_9GAMM|nr:disulfide bond formation protein DsbA [Halopseudomonas xinjiangensis]HEC46325.1 disulfide bond formation protein DsbA [Halopseudomonas xinjiangensis]
MNRRAIVLTISAVAIVCFAAAALLYQRYSVPQETTVFSQKSNPLVRFHSPVLGPNDAPVTIVEFFDPSCESCRALFPYVKQILAKYPNDVRLVVRYVLFHNGSEEAVRILESARAQGIYEPVLEAVLDAQPQWHDDPKILEAWKAAAEAGLDVEKAQEVMNSPEIDAILKKDAADVKTVGIQGTPTFFVNGKPLPKFGPQPLLELVQSEMEKAK